MIITVSYNYFKHIKWPEQVLITDFCIFVPLFATWIHPKLLIKLMGCRPLCYYLALVNSIPFWWVLAEIECTVYAAPPKRSINKFCWSSKRRQQVHILWSYCPNIYNILVPRYESAKIFPYLTWVCSLIHCSNDSTS